MKTLIHLLAAVLIFISLLLESAFAGGPPIQWQKTFGGSIFEEGYLVKQTSDGGYIIAGYTESYGAGASDVYLIKTDPNGNSQWQKTFGGTLPDRAYSVQQTFDGGYAVAGYTESYGAGLSDVYLIKTEPNGNSQWQRTFGGSGNDYGSSVQQTSDGGYIITGDTFPDFAGSRNVYLIKTEPNGNMHWQNNFGGSGTERGYSVKQTSDGGYIIAGSTSSYGAGSFDVYLIKTDPNGDMQWEKTFGRPFSDYGYSVRQTSDGGYIIVGETGYNGGPNPYADVYLIKTDPNGNSQWQKRFGGLDWNQGYSVQQTLDGGYIIAGLTSSSFRSKSYVYLVKTDPNGNSRWQKTFGGYLGDRGRSVQQTSDGGYIIVGSTYVLTDVYLVKLCPDGTLSADFNCNGTVYYEDLRILVNQWLRNSDIFSADIAPEIVDRIVNGFDFAALAQNWLQTTAP